MKRFLLVVGVALLGASGSASAAQYTSTILGTVGDGHTISAAAINNSGQVIGYSYLADYSSYHATLWDDGAVTDLGTLGGSFSRAFGINDSGQVVGMAFLAGDLLFDAPLWSGGAANPSALGGINSIAYGINNSGHVVGSSYFAGTPRFPGNSSTHATLWSGGDITDLGTLGGSYSNALGINNSGQVVGISDLAGNSSTHATLWDKGAVIDLNSFLDQALIDGGWVLRVANDINDSGWIVGDAVNQLTGQSRGYLLTPLAPVPEPETYALMLAGLAVVGAAARRSRAMQMR